MHKLILCLTLSLALTCSLGATALAAEAPDAPEPLEVSQQEAAAPAEAAAAAPDSEAVPEEAQTEEVVLELELVQPAEAPQEGDVPAAPQEAAPAQPAEEAQAAPLPEGPYFLVDGAAWEDPAMTLYEGVYYVSLTTAVRALRPDAAITWEGEHAVVTADGLTIRVRVGDQYLEANGRYLYIFYRVLTGGGQVLVPARIIAQAMGAWVEWHQDTGVLEFHSGSGAIEPGEAFYDSDSVYWLSRIIHTESGNQPLDGKLAVGTVIMNRVESPLFPDTIYDVIFAPNQFSPVRTGAIHREPNAESVIAAKLVLEGIRVGGDSLYFINPTTSPNSWAQRNRTYVTTIGAHSFFS